MSSIKVCAATNYVTVADPVSNAEQIMSIIDEAVQKETNIVAFPELALTGATCGDLFKQEKLIYQAEDEIARIVDFSKDKDINIVIGAPILLDRELFDAALIIYKGKILNISLKGFVDDGDFGDEARWFVEEYDEDSYEFLGQNVNVTLHEGVKLDNLGVKVAVLLGDVMDVLDEDVDIVINLCARSITADYVTGRELATALSLDTNALAVYVEAGEGESSTDAVYAGQNTIALGDKILASSDSFDNELVYAEVDTDDISNYKKEDKLSAEEYIDELALSAKNRENTRFPFIASEDEARKEMCETILRIQTKALVKRLKVVRSEKIVIGVSGGLDSTLALIVASLACEELGISKDNIMAITMPGFGTTTRTHDNATDMMKALGVTYKEIPIGKTVEAHFNDIGHDVNDRNATYENAQARMRTMILMDVANDINGLVVGTGDLSELALGWATYNGDHMSMYAVNADVPKTVIRVVVGYVAEELLNRDFLGNGVDNNVLSKVLKDIVDTPVSPELLPANEDDSIAQKTEDLVGPYELHDFFLYHVLTNENEPEFIYEKAVALFEGEYDKDTIKHWLKTFYRRFFTQQFKRSCSPDGPKVYSIGLSPRGGYVMPSDASYRVWLDAVERL